MTSDHILYLECCSGISGDMTVAALLDLGADEQKLTKALASLPLDGYRIQISRVKKSGLDACDFAVILDEEHENHDHDMAYLHGDIKMHDHVHGEHTNGSHMHDGDGCRESDHVNGHTHHHAHRGLPEIRQIIGAGALSDGAKKLAFRMFDILADAEAKAHGVPREEVHFHEVGAVDSIVDIVAVAVCLDDLATDRIIVSALSEGTGTVRCQHGVLPIPVPAVTNIVTAYGLPIHHTTVQGELVTPTGAAIAAAVMTEQNQLPADYTIEKVGIGAGKRAYETAGILRAMWIRPLTADRQATDGRTPGEGQENLMDRDPAETDCIVKLEANIDDATGEQLGYCMDCLMEAGARDVSFVPLFMKKNRPAYEVHVICSLCDVTRMEEVLFRETTTIGVRRSIMQRTVMERELRHVETMYGTATVKVCSHGNVRKTYPEYESVRKLCKEAKVDFCKVYQAILNAAE
ncbi:MAG: nickel pincer cofactor biosynthesis protein LarC [Lachnospiraceae bacterium]